MAKNLTMRYFKPAENSLDGWERYSLPIGNGYFGASVFGGTDTERIQFTTNTFANNYENGGVSDFGEVFIDFKHQNVTDYGRGLKLDTGVVYAKYNTNGISVVREAFTSYPDKVFAYKIKSDKATNDFDVRLEIPFLNERPVEQGGRTGNVTVENGVLVMRGTLPSRELIFEARLAAITDGEVISNADSITVKNATETVLLYTLDTSYKLCPEVFLDGFHKALGADPHDTVTECLDKAVKLGWDKLYKNHTADYCELIGRVSFDLGGTDNGESTEDLLKSYQNGNYEPYLEELYYAYGRHLLVSSSREGTPPASLQGVWTAHDKSPWTCGFWHNINVQMNYWPAFNTNLAETFKAYAGYWQNYQKQACINASNWVKAKNPENYKDGEGECGWIIGTGAWMYQVEGVNPNTHSGPGTGGLTTKMFWDYYDFTRDEDILRKYSYPAIHGMSKFLTKCVRNYDGRYLCSFSASPEQILSGSWVTNHENQQYYHTVGCAFDQQFIYENAVDDLKCAEALGESDETTAKEKEILDALGPIQIGYSGQIKEYDEEHFYGEIGEAHHRHLSQLVALTPGSIVTHSTPAWLDAAKLTLEMRGDQSTGWALAHRLNAWSRVGDGNHAYLLLNNLLRERTHPNLWDVHPPFQIDGNFGATAGMTEMVLQSHEGYVSLLPAIPDAWKNISFSGLVARGNFTIDCEYKNGIVSFCRVKSGCGEQFILRYDGITDKTTVKNSKGEKIAFERNGEYIKFDTAKNESYIIENFAAVTKRQTVKNLTAEWTDNGVKLNWNSCGKKCAVYRAVKNDSNYKLLTTTEKDEFCDTDYNSNRRERITYKVVICDNGFNESSLGTLATVNPATELEKERYAYKFKINNKLY